jgi:methylthioribose-1-phosphate isomerase
MRTIYWDFNKSELVVIDQRLLPAKMEYVSLRSSEAVVKAIQEMTVRGAPAIGAAAAFGLVLAAQESRAKNVEDFFVDLDRAAKKLKSSRPTAVNLAWAVERLLGIAEKGKTSKDSAQLCSDLLVEAQKLADEDVEINKRMAEFGATLINDGDTIIHHCNTGALAVVDWGTALGVIRTAAMQGKQIHVLVDETRPRLQGSRLTAWELEQYHIPYEIITDNMAGYFLSKGLANKVLFGADRIANNGDVANKIGTYMLALAAHDNEVPAYAVAPTSSIDLTMENGSSIPIEERNPQEVLDLQFHGEKVAPANAKALNPAFDITPNRLISAIITENGIIKPPISVNLPKYLNGQTISLPKDR